MLRAPWPSRCHIWNVMRAAGCMQCKLAQRKALHCKQGVTTLTCAPGTSAPGASYGTSLKACGALHCTASFTVGSGPGGSKLSCGFRNSSALSLPVCDQLPGLPGGSLGYTPSLA